MDWHTHVHLGGTKLSVSRLGIGSSYGVPENAVEKAFHEYGINYFYWGALRRRGMRDGIRSLKVQHRDNIVVAIQSYDKTGFLMPWSVERALKALKIERADILILGYHGKVPGKRTITAGQKMIERGLVRYLAVSGHNRELFGSLARGEVEIPVDIFMLRYNAAHRGAEQDIFPFLHPDRQFGVTAFTATRWGHLLSKRRMPRGEHPLTPSECYRFVLSNPNVHLCVMGPSSMTQFEQGIAALDNGPLSIEEMDRIRRIGDHIHDQGKLFF